MILQRLCKSENMPPELYYRGQAKTEDYGLSVRHVSFDTYFNLFALGIWKRYTQLDSLSVSVSIVGKGIIKLIGFGNDPDNRWVINTVHFSGTEATIVPLYSGGTEALPDHLYISIEANDAMLYDTIFSTEVAARPVRLACCFCTYKREKEIKNNIDRLYDGLITNKKSPLYGQMEIFISDNGNTLDEGDMPKGVHLFSNKNYGGSAGFTRCMIEATINQKGYTHLILMDDDALIEPYVVERTAALLGILRPEHRNKMIGGAMLCQEQPTTQLENGAWINPKNWRIVLPGKNRNLEELSGILANEEEVNVNYNGWFYCCVPASFITTENLPLPMFLHADDQEYGLRNGEEIILMNGICIWHPNPWARKRAYVEYYDARNAMIALSRTNPKLSRAYICFKEAYSILRHLVSYKYEEALYRIRGYHDFYNGPEWFIQQDAEKLNREIMGLYKTPTCELSREEIDTHLAEPEPEESKKKLRKLLNYFVPAYKVRIIYDENLPWGCIDPFAVKHLCVVNVKTGKGIQLTRSYKKLFQVMKWMVSLFFLIIKKHRNMFTAWSKVNLQSLEFWTFYLGL